MVKVNHMGELITRLKPGENEIGFCNYRAKLLPKNFGRSVRTKCVTHP
jgi:hypothetical protein